jgi:hypothetical protein
VTGAIGYLHGAASLELKSRYLQDPAAGALEIKGAILATVTPISSMRNQTVSGGVLNLLEASRAVHGQSLTLATNP